LSSKLVATIKIVASTRRSKFIKIQNVSEESLKAVESVNLAKFARERSNENILISVKIFDAFHTEIIS
jgi:hypothetical protein